MPLDPLTSPNGDLCSRCGTRERRAEDQRYCLECHNENMRDWRSGHARQTRYLRGVEAFRARAAREFEFLGIREMSGRRAAEIIRSLQFD